ncbi:MAG: cobalamin-dependent protein [Thermodesulfobacteriota bacterium]|jgi:methanogenic corrinoid protein MtbC1
MVNSNEIFKELCDAIRSFDEGGAKKAAEAAVEKKADLMKAIKEMSDTLAGIGEQFHQGELFLPHLVMAGDAMDVATKVFEGHLSKEEMSKSKIGTVVIGTVEGDLHDLGLNIVAMRLRTSGFEVHNLGRDTSVSRFVEKAQQVGADIIGASTLLTVTRSKHKDLVDEVRQRNLPFRVMVGGGPVTREYAQQIGADGYGEDGEEAVAEAKRIMEEKGRRR